MTLLLAASDPLDHVYQWTYVKSGEGFFGFTILSNHVIMQLLAALLLVLLMPRFARLRDSGDTVNDLTPRGFGNFIESICAYLRKEVAQPILHDYTDRFIPYIWSAFFYILTVNLLGLRWIIMCSPAAVVRSCVSACPAPLPDLRLPRQAPKRQ